MRTDEFKLRIMTGLERLIDEYYPGESVAERLANSSLRVMLKLNEDKLSELLRSVSDCEGNIDAGTIISVYAERLGAGKGTEINIKDYIGDGFLSSIIPDRSLIVTREDIEGFLN